MATQKQIDANRTNALKSTGPKSPGGKDVTKFNGLKHGLRAEQVVLPGESAAEFQAERDAWFADWKPASHTRAVLVERAAAASWRLRRSVRVEAARLRKLASAAWSAFDAGKADLLRRGMARLDHDPEAALGILRSERTGLDHLLRIVEGLLAACSEPAGWSDLYGHHERLMTLLGHPIDSDPEELGELAVFSHRLILTNDPSAGVDPSGPLGEAEAGFVADELRAACEELRGIIRAQMQGRLEVSTARGFAVDAACVDASKEAQLHHRYEMAHDRSLRATIHQLMALHRSGADLADEAAGPEAADEAPVAPDPSVAPTGANPPEPAAPTGANPGASEPSVAPTGADSHEHPSTSGPSGRDRGGRSWPVGADPTA